MKHDEHAGPRNPGQPLSPLSRRTLLRAATAGTAALAAPALIRPANAAILVHIGQIEPVTGPSAAYGIRGRDGAASAFAEIASAGGFHDSKGRLYQLAVHVGDMANDARQAITLYRQNALNPDVRANIGPTNSVGYVPIVPIAAQLRLLLIGEAGAPIKRWSPWAFRVDPVGNTAIPILLRTVVGKLHIKRLALIYDQTQDAQAGDAAVCRRMKGTLGYDLVTDLAFSSGLQDFSPQIARIKNAKPDAIFVAAATGDGVRLTAQLRAAGLDVPLMTGYGAFNDPVVLERIERRDQGRLHLAGAGSHRLDRRTAQLVHQLQQDLQAARHLVLHLRLRLRHEHRGGDQARRQRRTRQDPGSDGASRLPQPDRHPYRLQQPADRGESEADRDGDRNHRPGDLCRRLLNPTERPSSRWPV